MELVDCEVPFLLIPGINGLESGNLRQLRSIGGVPVITNAQSARKTFRELYQEDCTLTPLGIRWQTNLKSLRGYFPLSSLQLADVLP
jgi:hypothetical protein